VSVPTIPSTISDVLKETASLNSISVDQLLSRKHDRHIAWPRQEAMTALHRSGLYSLPQIGRAFKRDHTTVKYAKDRVAEREANDDLVAARVFHLTVIAEKGSQKARFYRHGALGFKSTRGQG